MEKFAERGVSGVLSYPYIRATSSAMSSLIAMSLLARQDGIVIINCQLSIINLNPNLHKMAFTSSFGILIPAFILIKL